MERNQKAVYLLGKRKFPNAYGLYRWKLGTAIEADIQPGLYEPANDYSVTLNVFGENVMLEYRKTPEECALLLARKIRQIVRSLKGIE